MTLDDIQPLLERNNVVTFTTFRKDARPQMSLVTVGRVGDALGFTSSRRSAKHPNLLRDPRCALMVTSPDWLSYAVLDGDAHLIGQHNTDANVLRDTLRDVYRARAGKEHPDWSAFDRSMVEQQGSAILLAPSRIYAYGL
jgi:PPOX class probable F420-dependent enzyme